MLKHSRKIVCIFILVFTLISGCSQAPQQMSANDYLSLAKQNKDNKQNYYFIKAADAYINQRQLIPANRLIQQMQQTNLKPNEQQLLLLVSAKYLLLKHDNSNAIALLNTINTQSLNKNEQIDRLRTLAQAYMQLNNWQQSIITLDSMLPLQNTKDKQDTIDTIWQILLVQPNDAINNAVTDNNDLTAWIDLAKRSRNATYATQLQNELVAWQQQYPNSPANALLPKDLQKLNIKPPKLQKVALLLPLTGKYATSGNAVRNGFVAAYYADNNSKPQLDIVDTNKGKVENLYKQAIANGAQMVVGPLIQNNVATIAKHDVPVPTFALNNVKTKTKNLFQFSLSPSDEARQIATRAWRFQHQNALIIMPNNRWGQTVAQAFANKWQSLGGKVAATATYTNIGSLKSVIRHALNIDQSYARKYKLQQLTGSSLRMVPQRRNDIDMVFVISNPAFAKQIKPLLNFYFAGSLDTYALSTSFDQNNNSSDISGMVFADEPWIINNQQLSPRLKDLASSINSTWPGQSNNLKRLNALGVDAYDLTSNLTRLQYFSAFGLPAASGVLFLDPNNGIVRQLNWATISHGKVRLLL